MIKIKYCRYCSHCIEGDCFYCTEKSKELNNINQATNCKSFDLSALGDVETGKQYKPREKKIKTNLQQTTLFDKKVEV